MWDRRVQQGTWKWERMGGGGNGKVKWKNKCRKRKWKSERQMRAWKEK